MINALFGGLSHDIGIDLGTANTLVYVKGRGIVIDEPSVVALNVKTKQILSIGAEAKGMLGRTPSSIVAIRPLVDGVVSDFEVTEQMLRYFIEKVHRQAFTLFPRPRVVIGIPSGVTEVEKRAVEDAALGAGARQVFLIEEPVAAAIGARLPIHDPAGSVIVDIGGGTTEVAMISLGGIVSSKSIRVAGDQMTADIIQFARDEYNLLLGERTAEDIKMKIGTAYLVGHKRLEAQMRGRDLISGLPKSILVTGEQMNQALSKSIQQIVDTIKSTLEESPPELVADLMDRGIILSGGGALLRGLDRIITEEANMPVHLVDDPLTCVVRGTGLVLEDMESLQDVLLTPRLEKVPK